MEKNNQEALGEKLLARIDCELRDVSSYDERLRRLNELQRLDGVTAGDAARLIQAAHNHAIILRRDLNAGVVGVTSKDVERATAVASYMGLNTKRVRNAYRGNKITSGQALIADMVRTMYYAEDGGYQDLIDDHLRAAYSETAQTLIELADSVKGEKQLTPTKQVAFVALGAAATTAVALSVATPASAYVSSVADEMLYISPQLLREFTVPVVGADKVLVEEVLEDETTPDPELAFTSKLVFSDVDNAKTIPLEKPEKVPEAIFIEPDLGNGNIERDSSGATDQERREEIVADPELEDSTGSGPGIEDNSSSSDRQEDKDRDKEKEKTSKEKDKKKKAAPEDEAKGAEKEQTPAPEFTDKLDVSRANETLWAKESLEKINQNMEIYKAVAERTNTPWQLGAALHMRESSLRMKNPSNGQGIFQLYTLNQEYGYDFPTGKVSKAEFERQLELAITFLKDAEIARGASPDDFDLEHPDVLKSSLFTYNGRAGAYERQARALGFTNGFEGSPYVMNLADDKRNSEINPEWKQILSDGGSMQKANQEPGAWPLIEGLVKIGTATDGDKGSDSEVEKPIEPPKITGWAEGAGGEHELTYFNQHSAQWANKPYRFHNSPESSGTISLCGCGPSSFAMAIKTMTNIDTDPEEMAKFFMDNGGPLRANNCASNWIWETNPGVFEREFGVRIERISGNDAAIKAAIDNGGMVLMSQGPGMFTSSGHIMMVTGYVDLPNKDGGNYKYLVGDPNSTSKTADLEGYSPSVMIGDGRPVPGVGRGGAGADRGHLKAAWSITPVGNISPAASEVMSGVENYGLGVHTPAAYEEGAKDVVPDDWLSPREQTLREDEVVKLRDRQSTIGVPKITKEQRRAAKIYAKLV